MSELYIAKIIDHRLMAQAMVQGGDPLDLFPAEADSAIAYNLVW